MLGLGDIVDAVNAEVTGGTQSVRLRVRAGFQPGSFIVDLEMVRAGYQRFIELFNGQQAVAWSTFLSLIGVGGVAGLIQLLRKARGRLPRRVVEIQHTEKLRVEFEGGDEVEVDKSLWRLFNSPAVRSGFSRLVRPLRNPEIAFLELKGESGGAERIEASEVEFFSVPAAHEGELVTESERVLRVVGLSFKAGNKWRVTEGAAAYSVTISDPDFLRRVESGAERFGANDYLRVLLRTAQWTEGGQLKASYSVLRVIDVIRSASQQNLALDEGDDSPSGAG